MKLIDNIKLLWLNTIDDFNLNSKDKLMKKAFNKIILSETEDRESFFNLNNLRSTNNFSEVVYVIDIPEEYQLKGQQWQIMDKLNENSFFISRYLRELLLLGDNVSQPEYYHIEDPSSGKPFSCRYLAIWNYQPVLTTKKRIYTANITLGSLITAITSTILLICL